MSVSLELARRLHALGLSLIPLQPKSKLPDGAVLPKDENGDATGKPFQTTRCTDDDLIAWFGNGQSRNAGIVLGPVSGVVVIESERPEAETWCAENLRTTPMMRASAPNNVGELCQQFAVGRPVAELTAQMAHHAVKDFARAHDRSPRASLTGYCPPGDERHGGNDE